MGKVKVKVKVISCSTPILWYKNFIGEVFECTAEPGFDGPHFVHNKDHGFYTEDIIVLDEIDDLQEAGVRQ